LFAARTERCFEKFRHYFTNLIPSALSRRKLTHKKTQMNRACIYLILHQLENAGRTQHVNLSYFGCTNFIFENGKRD